jgi:hypothetical protein
MDQRLSLVVGGYTYRNAFESDAERRQAWAQWRERLLSTCRYDRRPELGGTMRRRSDAG